MDRETPTSRSRKVSHVSFEFAVAIAQYFSLVLDQDIVGCFLALQESQLDPINIKQPKVDLLVSGHPAKAASENHKDG